MPPEKCTICLKPKSAREGSLTQWINICSCDLSTDGKEPVAPARCKACGKTVRDKRSGSMTQWVFQQEGCNCDRPEVEFTSSPKAFKQASFKGFDDKGEVEIELEPGKFPADRYKPLSVLGAGVSGTVYLSRDRLLGKRVAVKVLRVLERDALVSFQNEAKTTSKLTHPNIVKVLDFGSTSGGVPFMVMEFVPGISLETLIKQEGALDFELAKELFIDLANALEYAHNSHILHRDLKPSNILVVENQGNLSANLIDFGVAKLQEHLQTSTIYNGTALVGTPAYMSPDQAMGRKFDERSDIYSLGCIMFEALTAETVFVAHSPLELIALHAKADPPPLLDYFQESPTTQALADIVKRCLEKDADSRYQSVSDLKEALIAVPRTPRDVLTQIKNDDNLADRTADGGRRLNDMAFAVIGVSLLALGTLFYIYVELNKHPVPDARHLKNQTYDRSKALEALSAISESSLPVESLRGTLRASTDKAIRKFVQENPRLKTLYLEGAKISPAGLRQLKKLFINYLAIANTSLTPEHIDALAEIPTLQYLSISGERLDVTALSKLRHTRLYSLTVRNGEITDKGLAAIATIESLSSLSLHGCTGLQSARIKKLAKLRFLSSLELTDTDTTDQTLQNLISLKRLKHLDLSGTSVTDNVFKEISNSYVGTVTLLNCPRTKTRPTLPGRKIYFDIPKQTPDAEVNNMFFGSEE